MQDKPWRFDRLDTFNMAFLVMNTLWKIAHILEFPLPILHLFFCLIESDIYASISQNVISLYQQKAKALHNKKQEGNAAFTANKYQEAHTLYSEALSIDPRNKVTNAKLYYNRGLVSAKVTLMRLLSVLMLCTPDNHLQPFLYHMKMADFKYFCLLSIFSWKNWQTQKVYWIWQVATVR